jgi:hypothetical protein
LSAAFAREFEAAAIGFQARRVAQSNVNAGAFSDPIANAEEVVASLWRESDGSSL